MLRKEFLYDKRLADRLIKAGTISKDAYKKHLNELPDVSDKSSPLTIGPKDEPASDAETGD